MANISDNRVDSLGYFNQTEHGLLRKKKKKRKEGKISKTIDRKRNNGG